MDLPQSSGAALLSGHSVPSWVAAVAIAAGIGTVLFFLRLAALPRPIPGIPYNKHSARRILGDIPDIVRTKHLRDWTAQQCIKLDSPMVQVFPRPFSAPWVIVSDFREAQDILLRRSKEFDRSDVNHDIFGGVIPNHHIAMKSSDHRFKYNKLLVKDLMSPGFLNEVC